MAPVPEPLSTESTPAPHHIPLPRGFAGHVANVGIKDATDDFVVVAAEGSCAAAGVFTLSRFAGPSVVVSRENLEGRSAQAVVVISKNANVATGAEGLATLARSSPGLPTPSAAHRPTSSSPRRV